MTKMQIVSTPMEALTAVAEKGIGEMESTAQVNPKTIVLSTSNISIILQLNFYSYSDIDECAEDSDNCNINASCTDNIGSFDCACNSGFSGDGVNCASKQFLILLQVCRDTTM